jgi:hypothetical protein
VRPAFRNRWLFVSSTACSALALALSLAGCGGSSDGGEQAPPPSLAADVGAFFVQETEEVTDALEAGEPEIARGEALELRQLVQEEIDAGRVPRALRAPLLAAVERLIASIEVPAEPPPPPAPEPPPTETETGACAELEQQKEALEAELDALDQADPAREALKEQLKAVSDQLKECEKAEDGQGEDGGDDD